MTVRYGLTERLQLGMQAGLSYGRAEATFQVLETPIVDLALGADLGLGASPVQVEHDVERKSNLYPSLGVPVLGGLRPLPALSVVGHLGPAYCPARGRGGVQGDREPGSAPAGRLRPGLL